MNDSKRYTILNDDQQPAKIVEADEDSEKTDGKFHCIAIYFYTDPSPRVELSVYDEGSTYTSSWKVYDEENPEALRNVDDPDDYYVLNETEHEFIEDNRYKIESFIRYFEILDQWNDSSDPGHDLMDEVDNAKLELEATFGIEIALSH